MAVRHKLRHQIIIDRLNNPDNLWSYDNLAYTNENINLINILKYNTNNWRWNYISQNSNIIFETIVNNPDLPWNWTYISLNKNITWDIVLNNPDYPWDWDYLSCYKPITWSIIKLNIDLFKERLNWGLMGYKFDFEILENLGLSVPWNFQSLSYCSIINWDIVIKFKHQNWNWDYLSESENLDYNIIVEHIYKPWNWDKISLKLKITSQVLSSNTTNHNWNWNILSQNNSITEEILINNPDNPWNWSKLSSCRNSISKEFVLNNPDKAWDYNILAANNIIIKDKITDWDLVSQNLEMSLEFIKENIDLFMTEQQWRYISRNKNIDFDFILQYKHKPLNWFDICLSKYITYEHVSNNRNLSWDWGVLSGNKNMLDIEVEFRLKAREYLAAYKIQQYWFRAYYNPEYLICQKRLYNEFENLTRV
jgi:hypothetical protein